MAAMLDRLPGGALIVDEQAVVLSASAGAERILARRDGLVRLEGGYLRVGNRRDDA